MEAAHQKLIGAKIKTLTSAELGLSEISRMVHIGLWRNWFKTNEPKDLSVEGILFTKFEKILKVARITWKKTDTPTAMLNGVNDEDSIANAIIKISQLGDGLAAYIDSNEAIFLHIPKTYVEKIKGRELASEDIEAIVTGKEIAENETRIVFSDSDNALAFILFNQARSIGQKISSEQYRVVASTRKNVREFNSWKNRVENFQAAEAYLNKVTKAGANSGIQPGFTGGTHKKTFPDIKQLFNENRLAVYDLAASEFRITTNEQRILLTKFGFDANHFTTLALNMKISTRLITSLASKPFAILAGGTGTGKTKCAIEVARKVCRKHADGESADYEVVAVGADWTDTRPLLGYENILGTAPTYTVPKALDLIIRASRNQDRPHFLILDEMNLSHVERYFSDFLSLMEAKKIDKEASEIKLHSNKKGMPSTDGNAEGTVDQRIPWPDNLFVVGTVNVDETTHMFSPKVLDRAHVIEFKPDEKDVAQGLEDKWSNTDESDAAQKAKDEKDAGSWSMALTATISGIEKANEVRKYITAVDQLTRDKIKNRIMGAWNCLKGSKFSFSHRTAQEAADYIFVSHMVCLKHKEILEFDPTWDKLIDLAFLQKILPKINGSVETLSAKADKKDPKEASKETTLLDVLISEFRKDAELKLCIQKLEEMKATLEREHFVSFIQ